MAITTHTGVQLEGLAFPTVAGTYKIGFTFDFTGTQSAVAVNHLYLEVYGTKFSAVTVTPMVTLIS